MRAATVGWLALGLVVSGAYGTACLWTAAFTIRSSRTEGTVIDAEPHRSVSFDAADGTRHVFVQNGHLDAAIGQHVPVGYLPGAPDTARVVTFETMWNPLLLFLPAALGFGIAPHRRRGKPAVHRPASQCPAMS